jgi:hypothetical protein
MRGSVGRARLRGPAADRVQPARYPSRARADGALQLLVVQHGGRESVEMFEVIPCAAPRVQLAWRGCAISPDGGLNDVVALPDGGFLATRFAPGRRLAFMFAVAKAMLFGGDTGWVYAWSRERGFSEVPGTRAPGPNGIELSERRREDLPDTTLASEVRRIDRAAARSRRAPRCRSPTT